MQCNSTDCLTIKTVLLLEKLGRIRSVNSVSSYVADSNSYNWKFWILHKPVSNHQKLSSNTIATNQSTLATTPTFYLPPKILHSNVQKRTHPSIHPNTLGSTYQHFRLWLLASKQQHNKVRKSTPATHHSVKNHGSHSITVILTHSPQPLWICKWDKQWLSDSIISQLMRERNFCSVPIRFHYYRSVCWPAANFPLVLSLFCSTSSSDLYVFVPLLSLSTSGCPSPSICLFWQRCSCSNMTHILRLEVALWACVWG